MSEWTHKDGVDGIKKQTQELIEQAYQKGFKAGQVNNQEFHESICDGCKKGFEDREMELIEYGRNEAWEAARKISSRQVPYEIFGIDKTGNGICFASPLNWGETITATEAIERIRVYEEQKKTDEEIKVGDEVTYTFDNGISIKPFVVLKIRCLEDGEKYYEGLETSDMRWVGGGLDYKKTGRTFPEIAEVLKKLKEASE